MKQSPHPPPHKAIAAYSGPLIEGAEEYYQSEEFWREWYSEGDERFTREGERI